MMRLNQWIFGMVLSVALVWGLVAMPQQRHLADGAAACGHEGCALPGPLLDGGDDGRAGGEVNTDGVDGSAVDLPEVWRKPGLRAVALHDAGDVAVLTGVRGSAATRELLVQRLDAPHEPHVLTVASASPVSVVMRGLSGDAELVVAEPRDATPQRRAGTTVRRYVIGLDGLNPVDGGVVELDFAVTGLSRGVTDGSGFVAHGKSGSAWIRRADGGAEAQSVQVMSLPALTHRGRTVTDWQPVGESTAVWVSGRLWAAARYVDGQWQPLASERDMPLYVAGVGTKQLTVVDDQVLLRVSGGSRSDDLMLVKRGKPGRGADEFSVLNAAAKVMRIHEVTARRIDETIVLATLDVTQRTDAGPRRVVMSASISTENPDQTTLTGPVQSGRGGGVMAGSTSTSLGTHVVFRMGGGYSVRSASPMPVTGEGVTQKDVIGLRLAFHLVKIKGKKDPFFPFEDNSPAAFRWANRFVDGMEVEVPARDEAGNVIEGETVTHHLGGVHGRLRGTGIRPRVVSVDTAWTSEAIATTGSVADYRRIARLNHKKNAINVYVVPRVADHRGEWGGVALRRERSLLMVNRGGQVGVSSRTLVHELGHMLGLPHTRRGIMISHMPPFMKLKDKPAGGGAFTPTQIKIMQRNIPRYAYEPIKD